MHAAFTTLPEMYVACSFCGAALESVGWQLLASFAAAACKRILQTSPPPTQLPSARCAPSTFFAPLCLTTRNLTLKPLTLNPDKCKYPLPPPPHACIESRWPILHRSVRCCRVQMRTSSASAATCMCRVPTASARPRLRTLDLRAA
eukprot:49846-Chlamydomonas_euryale.AAC.1